MHAYSTAIFCLVTAGSTLAQAGPGEIFINIPDRVLEPGESTSVRLLAGFDSTSDFAVAGVLTSLIADADGIDVSSAWSDVNLVAPMDGPGTTSGVPNAGGFTGITAGQLNFPPAGPGTDTSNPIGFWQATFTAPMDQGSFVLNLSTVPARFDVYIERSSSRAESRLDGLTEGASTITVVPAPASALVLLGLLANRRRREEI